MIYQKLLLWVVLSPLFIVNNAFAQYLEREDVQQFIEEMVNDEGLSGEWVVALMGEAKYHQSIIDAISRPAERTLNWGEYAAIFLTDARRDQGAQFWRTHESILAEASEIYGVPEEIIVAIIGVETFYGRITGNYPVLDALATLAFDYPPRSAFFRDELRQFLLLSNGHDIDPLTLTGSYAGAMGMAQFISSSYRAYAVDADGDGFANLWSSPRDAIFSVANYLARHGWQRDQPIFARVGVPANLPPALFNQSLETYTSVGELTNLSVTGLVSFAADMAATLMQLKRNSQTEYWVGLKNFYVITRYNHSHLYAMAVASLAAEIAAEI